MTTHLALQRILLPSTQVSSLTTGSITLPSARGRNLGDYDLIESVEIPAVEYVTVEFANIPQTYKSLQIMASIRTKQAGNGGSGINIRFNNDSTSNAYRQHRWYANGTTNTTDSGQGTTGQIGNGAADGNSASLFQPNLIDIMDYTSSKHKTAFSISGGDFNAAAGYVMMNSVFWSNTAAITSIQLFEGSGSNNFARYSKFSLYGIRG